MALVIKVAARDIVIEDIFFIVGFHKYEEEIFEVENVNVGSGESRKRSCKKCALVVAINRDAALKVWKIPAMYSTYCPARKQHMPWE